MQQTRTNRIIILALGLLSVWVTNVLAQADTVAIDTLPHQNLEKLADTVFSTLGFSKVKTGILVDKVFPFCDARSFTGDTTIDSIQIAATSQILNAYLFFASVTSNRLIQPDTLTSRVNHAFDQNLIPIPIIRFFLLFPKNFGFCGTRLRSLNEC